MMKRVIDISPAEVAPTEEGVLRALGVPPDQPPGERVRQMLAEALEAFHAEAQPRGVFAEIDAREFAAVYEGEGDNEIPSPLAAIFPRAERLALFAATVGAPLSERIAALFDEGQLALGATLDAAASEGTELTGVHLDRVALDEARRAGAADAATRILRYSPGSCGWNITGPRALFAALGPEEIGVSLNASCLMEPLKSISGVMVMGPVETHDFSNDYGFCEDCRTKDCRSRIQNLR